MLVGILDSSFYTTDQTNKNVCVLRVYVLFNFLNASIFKCLNRFGCIKAIQFLEKNLILRVYDTIFKRKIFF